MPDKAMNQSYDSGARQHQGCRAYQEDAFDFLPLTLPDHDEGGLLMVLADGMGGHNGGAHASKAAVQSFVQAYSAAASEPETERLERALLAANQRIARDAEADAGLRGMGCTLVGVSLMPHGIQWVSVGDSPLFLFRNGELIRLNADHSMAPILQSAVLLGEMSDEDVACHPSRQALRSAVMGKDLPLIDLCPEPVEFMPGDRLLLASDGIDTLPKTQIARILGQNGGRSAEEFSRILVEAVIKTGNPHQDNVTVMVAARQTTEAPQVQARSGLPFWLAGKAGARTAFRMLAQPRVLFLLGMAFLLAAIAVNLFFSYASPSPVPENASTQPVDETAATGNIPDQESHATQGQQEIPVNGNNRPVSQEPLVNDTEALPSQQLGNE